MIPLPESRMQNLKDIYGALLKQAPDITSIAEELTQQYGYRPSLWTKDVVYAVPHMENDTNQEGYFFDAILSSSHTEKRQITSHPVQWGAAITDHSYQQPSVVTLEIGMSDAMQPFSEMENIRTSAKGDGRSIKAFEVFCELQRSGNLITLQTRLKTYRNMLITNIDTKDDFKTHTSLKCNITFEEIFIGTTSTTSASRFPEATSQDSASSVTPAPYAVPGSIAYKGLNRVESSFTDLIPRY